MTLICREDRALLESNPSTWHGSAEDSRGSPRGCPAIIFLLSLLSGKGSPLAGNSRGPAQKILRALLLRQIRWWQDGLTEEYFEERHVFFPPKGSSEYIGKMLARVLYLTKLLVLFVEDQFDHM